MHTHVLIPNQIYYHFTMLGFINMLFVIYLSIC